METHVALLVVNLLLHISNVLLHSFGSFILLGITRQHNSKPPMVLLLGLSATEATINLVETLRYVVEFVDKKNKAIEYLIVIDLSGAWVLLYLIMHCIVIDRLLICKLETKYQRFITKRRMLSSLLVLIVLSVCLMLGTVIGVRVDPQWEWEDVFFMMIYPCFHITFLTISVTSYSYIFYKIFVESQRKMHSSLAPSPGLMPLNDTAAASTKHRGTDIQSNTTHTDVTVNVSTKQTKVSALEMLRKFYISILLVSTYIVFLIVPDLVYLFYGIVGGRMSDMLVDLCWFFWNLSNISDAVIYLYINAIVRKKALATIKRCCRCLNTNTYL